MSYVGGKERQRLASEGKALPDGSYPIRNKRDLKHAKEDFDMHSAHYSTARRRQVSAWINKKADELNAPECKVKLHWSHR